MPNKTRTMTVLGEYVILYPSGIAQVCCKKIKADVVMAYLVAEGFIERATDFICE